MEEPVNGADKAVGGRDAEPKSGLNVARGKTYILIVDDERFIRMILCATLKSAGYVPVEAASVEEATQIIREHPHAFSAVISDIMMGKMDGFDFRSLVREIDSSIPFFFMTALDPEEGSGFLKRIVTDPLSYYLPKAVGPQILLKRVQRVVASRRVERFIENQMEETNRSLKLAAHIQHSMLPLRVHLDDRSFYATWWQPKEIVSGDIYEVIPSGPDARIYILGDIQGHGTAAALAMTAVQSFLKNVIHSAVESKYGPVEIANLLQGFFRDNLAEVSYMTALICMHQLDVNKVQWISCGAPNLLVSDSEQDMSSHINPNQKGGLPIGLFPDTVYTQDDVVENELTQSSVCVAITDGLYDLSADKAGHKRVTPEFLREMRVDFVKNARQHGSLAVDATKFMVACQEYGYRFLQDDVTILAFGAWAPVPGVFEAAIQLTPTAVDDASRKIGEWCKAEGWSDYNIHCVQLVLEEKVMNVYEHGFDDVERLNEVVCIRLQKRRDDDAELTIWDWGTPEPSLAVAAGNSDTAFEILNRGMSDHGRGRLMVRELCCGVERKRYGGLNETVYHVKNESPATGESTTGKEGGDK
ncbi:MAG: SpoIIE family protein phosphatase [Kiritimatiellae bacterium]|nr:SpoIIE family protein phosphatase [Kiritimatiellia bacterium]